MSGVSRLCYFGLSVVSFFVSCFLFVLVYVWFYCFFYLSVRFGFGVVVEFIFSLSLGFLDFDICEESRFLCVCLFFVILVFCSIVSLVAYWVFERCGCLF